MENEETEIENSKDSNVHPQMYLIDPEAIREYLRKLIARMS